MKRQILAAAVLAAALSGWCGESAFAGPSMPMMPAAQAAPAAPSAPAVAPDATSVPPLVMGVKAPEIDAVDLDGKPVTLASLEGKPVVLQFGSLTEPIFRLRAEDSEKLAARYGNKVTFVVLYQRESHAADGADAIEVNVQQGYGIAAPVNETERVKLAQQAVERLKIKHQVVAVDAWSNASSLRYGGYPNMAFVLDAKGNLQAGYAWMDPAKVKGALNALLADKPVPAEFRGRTEPSSPGTMDLAGEAREMGGYRGAGIAIVLDDIKMTDKQKEAVYPLLGEYLAQAKDLREKRLGGGVAAGGAAGRKPALAAAGGAPAPTGAAGDTMMQNAAADGIKTESPEDLLKALQTLRATAKKLKAAVKENLSEKDAKAVLEALSQGPAKRLFAD